MPKLYIDPLVIGTFARLNAASALVETIDNGIPTAEEKEDRDLHDRAVQEAWEPGEYFGEKDILDQNFHIWIPTFAAYSVVILLHSIVETQLYGLAEHLGKNCGSQLLVKDVPGKGIDQSALYLKQVASLPVKTDSAWACLRDLQSLRNIVAHRNGRHAELRKHQETEDKLIRKYPRALQFQKPDGFHEQLWISMHLCRDFLQSADGFFERVFKAAGLPNRHCQLDNPAGDAQGS